MGALRQSGRGVVPVATRDHGGVSHFLIRGFDPLIDAIEYGREVIPLTRKLIAERGAAKGVAAA